MMRLLEGFCPDWAERYDRLHHTAAADTFRATLMVSALSYAFSTDMREEFRLLNFPISDQLYNELYNSPTGVGNERESVPLGASQFNCFPNPFNPATEIMFQVPGACHVKLAVIDLLGNEVATLVNESKPAGHYSVEFDGSSFASGVYFCRMQMGAFAETKKLLLLR
jgi:hypothetical protein